MPAPHPILLAAAAVVVLFPLLYRLAGALAFLAARPGRRAAYDGARASAVLFAGLLAAAAALGAAALAAGEPGDLPRVLVGRAVEGGEGARGALFAVAAGAAVGALLHPAGLAARAAWVRLAGGAGGAPETSWRGRAAAQGLAERSWALLAALVLLEEFLWRGVLGAALGAWGLPAAVVALATAASYASLHVHWGARETAVHGLNGLVYWALFAWGGAGLLAPAAAHAALNALIYRRWRRGEGSAPSSSSVRA